MGDEDEDNDASVEERSESSRVSRPKRKRGVMELEKFGDDVDSVENNQYNYDDFFPVVHRDLIGQCRVTLFAFVIGPL